MDKLTIKQTEKIIGWSYPTALDFAKQHGELVDGKWLIPFDVVSDVVNRRVVSAQQMLARLTAEGNNK